MTSEQFAYWLQGFAEIHNGVPTEQEWKVIQDHLALVFKKVTPQYTMPLLEAPKMPFDMSPYRFDAPGQLVITC